MSKPLVHGAIRASHPNNLCHRSLGWDLFRFLVAALLFGAYLLKAHKLWFGVSVDSSRLLASPYFAFLELETELFVALWLLTGFHASRAKWAVVCLFVVFFEVALLLVAREKTNCGCFGVAQIPPPVGTLARSHRRRDGTLATRAVQKRVTSNRSASRRDGCFRVRIAERVVRCGIVESGQSQPATAGRFTG